MTRLIGTSNITLGICVGCAIFVAWAQNPAARPQRDAVAEAQQPQAVKTNRPEQQKSAHDQSDIFDPSRAEPASPVFKTQPKEGKVSGFDFARIR